MRKLTSLVLLLLCYAASFAQVRTVTGTVTDSKGNPVPFASLKFKNSAKGTSADAKGVFSLQVDKETSVTVSSTGYGSVDVSLAGVSGQIGVTLTETTGTMDEVIVTAGGVKAKRKELGTATTVVRGESITAGKTQNIANGLQGKVAGLQISGTGGGVNPSYRIVLRGQRSLTGNNQALIVLDNVVVPSTVLGNLNPEDVQDVVVLNGGGAAALYGSQASNGAIIITTKKGKVGVNSVVVSNTTTIEQVAFYPKIQKRFGAGGTAYGLDANGRPFYNYLENQSYGAEFDGTLRELGPPLEDGRQDSAIYAYNDGHFKFWEKGITNQSDFSLSSGDANSTFYLSGQYATVSGTTPGDNYNRATLRANGSRKIGNTINVTYSTAYTQNRYDVTSQTGSMYGNMLNMPSNVDITKYKNWRTDPFASPNGYYNPWYQNPYFTADNYRSDSRNDYLTANVQVMFTPITGLDFILRQGLSTRNGSNKNTVGAYNYSDYAEHTEASGKSDISAQVSDGSFYQTNLLTDAIAQYQRKFSNFSLNALAGGQWIQDQSKYVNVSANGLVVPDLFNVSNGVGTPGASESNYKARTIGLYSQVQLGYKDIIFVKGTARNDWVTTLSPDNRSFFYPGVDVSFVASDAFDFIKDSRTISYLKIRGGWSKVGNVNLGGNYGAYALSSTFGPANGFPYGSLAGYTLGNGLVASDLRPEITKGYEVGFDLNALKDRFTSSFTWFDTKTDDQTVVTGISGTTGYTSLLTNTGQTQSRGVELTAHYNVVRNKDWNVTIGGNWSWLDNTVNFLKADLPRLQLGGESYAVPGQVFPVIMGFDYNRDPNGHVIVDRTTGLPTKTAAITKLGNAAAKNKGGFDASVSYKGLTLSALVEYRLGYQIYNSMGGEMDWSGTGYRTAVYNRESFVYPNSVYEDPTKPGTYITNTDVAIANGNGNNGFWTDGINRDVTSNYVTSGNFWKLREIALSYNLPKSVIGAARFIKSATVSVQGRNLFLWMAKDNLYTDPEYSNNGADSNAIGVTSLNSAPPSRFYGGTLTLRF
ncbi:MAG: SusC/RagA family TonB-linked outer membrane protein [Sphingobacteriales bacterium]|nr:MAG: SusC/RagA family TonB-linked outer membrane protein [Sphingobacteriales bacterium]